MDDELSPDELDDLANAMGGSADEPASEESEEKTPEEAPPAEEAEKKEETETTEEAPKEEASEAGGDPNISHAQFMQLEEADNAEEPPTNPIERMFDVKVNVEVVLGSTRMTLEEILKLQNNSVIELNKLAGETVDILANNKLIAKAEVVVIDDNFGVKIVEIAGTKQKFSTLAQ